MFRRRKTIRVLVATRNPKVSNTLVELQEGKTRVEVEVVEALSTQGAYNSLPGCTMAVIDADDLVLSPGLARETLVQTLEQAEIPTVGGQEFAAEPLAWIEQAISTVGLLEALPPRTVVLAGHSGGVGKTTLSLNLARYVAGKLRLPVAVVEVCFGRSSLQTLADTQLPDLHDVVTQGEKPGRWQGITLLPMNYASARLLLSRPDEVGQVFDDLAQSHALTVVDAAAANPFFPHFQKKAQAVLAVADPRPDAVVNAQVLVEDTGNGPSTGTSRAKPVLSPSATLRVNSVEGACPELVEGSRGSGQCMGIILNKVNGVGDKLALSAVQAAARLPYVSRPDQDRRLAEALLQVIYPGWRPK